MRGPILLFGLAGFTGTGSGFLATCLGGSGLGLASGFSTGGGGVGGTEGGGGAGTAPGRGMGPDFGNAPGFGKGMPLYFFPSLPKNSVY